MLRDGVSGAPLLARSLLGATADDLVPLREQVHTVLTGERPEERIPIRGVISDGQISIRHAVARALPGVPHQVGQFHYLGEAAPPLFEADRRAKKALKKRVRGGRPIERRLESQSDAPAEAARSSCLAVRSALTDDGRPPLAAAGLKRKERLEAIADALDRVQPAPEVWDAAKGPTERTAHGQGG